MHKINTGLIAGALILQGTIALFAQEKKEDVVVLDTFVSQESKANPFSGGADKSVNSVFGFDKSLLDTPRTVTVITNFQLDTIGIKSSNDIIKLAPATYSNFRFGLEGNLSIRNQTSDFYFRGMKRLDPQGNFRTIYTANDSMEIVEGPPSPVYGLGRIGGYVNFNPKTGRASTGKYLDSETGNAKVTYGSFDKKVLSGDISGPANFMGKPGGFAVYAYVENSGGWQVNGFHEDEIIQATYSVNVTKQFRAETGMVIQHSYGGLPGGDNHTTRDTIQTNTYWGGGGYSYHMDENGDGKISEQEIRNAYFGGIPQQNAFSNVAGRQAIGASPLFNAGVNETLFRIVPWQGGVVNGGTITLDQFKTGYTDTSPTLVGGSAVHRMGYQLMVYPTMADGNVYPKGAPGQIPNTAAAKQAFYLSPVFDINPDGWVKLPWNKRMSLGEDFYRANIGAFYFDLINDYNPDQTIKNQIFVDGHKQVKDGSNGFSQWQQPTTFEDKITFTKKFRPTNWWELNFLSSINSYMVWSNIISTNGDFDMRRDLQRSGNNISQTFTAQDRFYSITENRSMDGYPASTSLYSEYTVSGLGILTDQTFFNRVNLMLGGRWDYVDAKTTTPAGVYTRSGSSVPNSFYLSNVGTNGPAYLYANSGFLSDQAFTFKGNTNGPSMSASLTLYAPWGLRPYFTAGQQTILLDQASAHNLTLTQTKNALVGRSTLMETGLKGSFSEKLTFSVTAYEQVRASFDPITTVAGGPNSTISRGLEAQIKWNPLKNFSLTVGGTWSKQKFQQGGNVSLTARDVGFPDVVDASGKVIIPAEAFGWGGRLSTVIPDSDPRFRKVPGIPDRVITAIATYYFANGLFFQANMLHKGHFALDRLETTIVPQTYIFDIALGVHKKKWDIVANVGNIFNRSSYSDNTFLYFVSPDHPQAVDVSFSRHF
jgi:iron complex outermembrane receptor protein